MQKMTVGSDWSHPQSINKGVVSSSEKYLEYSNRGEELGEINKTYIAKKRGMKEQQ
jgi:hypothetical protein